jgi:glycosyltransferase involved in cell wall biosynthesis
VNIVFDSSKLKHPATGLGQYCLHLLRNIIPLLPSDWNLILFYDGVKSDIEPFFPNSTIITSVQELKSIPVDLVHLAHQGSSKIKHFQSKAKWVVTVHDLNFTKRYHAIRVFIKRQQLQRILSPADAIIAISNFTAAELVHHKLVDKRKMHVIHNGLTLLNTDAVTNSEPGQAYFLVLGAVHARKNLDVLIPLMKFFKGYQLVFAGPVHETYAKRLRKLATKHHVEHQLVIKGVVNEQEKERLLQQCTALFFPSLSEGFGLPIIEAMYFGKPVFAANSSSLPEIGGDLAFYWNDFSPESMVQCISNGLAKAESDKLFSNKLHEHAKGFSWEKAAKAYLKVYQDLLLRQ